MLCRHSSRPPASFVNSVCPVVPARLDGGEVQSIDHIGDLSILLFKTFGGRSDAAMRSVWTHLRSAQICSIIVLESQIVRWHWTPSVAKFGHLEPAQRR